MTSWQALHSSDHWDVKEKHCETSQGKQPELCLKIMPCHTEELIESKGSWKPLFLSVTTALWRVKTRQISQATPCSGKRSGMPWNAPHSRCFDCDRPEERQNILDVMRSLQQFDRLPKTLFSPNANCIEMLVNGLIYRHRWFTMCTGEFSTASQIYHLKFTLGCWYAKHRCALWLPLPLNRTLWHNHF